MGVFFRHGFCPFDVLKPLGAYSYLFNVEVWQLDVNEAEFQELGRVHRVPSAFSPLRKGFLPSGVAALAAPVALGDPGYVPGLRAELPAGATKEGPALKT